MSNDDKEVGVIPLTTLKYAYLEEGLSDWEISQRYYFPLKQVKLMIKKHGLEGIRQSMISDGLNKIQNQQLEQAEKLVSIESQFKTLKLVQLQNTLDAYLTYFGKWGDFYKRNPVTQSILKDTNGMPMQLNVPNVVREIREIKESVTFSDEMKKILNKIESLIHPPVSASDMEAEVENFNIDDLFKKGE